MTYKQMYCRQCGKVHAFGTRPQAVRLTWQQMALDGAKDAAEVILGVVVFLGLFLGIPFLLWLVAS